MKSKKLSPIKISLSVASTQEEPSYETEDLEMDRDQVREKAATAIRKLMDDIWNRYPRAEVISSNFDMNNIVFEVK